MAKKLPAWQIMGLDGPPPVVNGYHHYGTVYSADQGPQRESLRHVWDTATWSWSYWGKKVRRDILAERLAGRQGSAVQVLADAVALVLVRLAERIHRPKG